MSEPRWTSLKSLPAELALLVDEVCTRFEEQWKQSRRPCVEECLGEFPKSAREALLRELLPLDVEYRRRLSETPSLGDYAHLFPDGVPGWLTGELTHCQMAGRFHLAGELGRGGMGVVYLAHDPDLGRELAVKVLREDHRDIPEAEARFQHEARVTAWLQHPNIPPVHERGRLGDGRPYFAMKLVRPHTLDDLLSARVNCSEDLPRYIQVFVQVCQGVAHAHSRGVIHRDLKPHNVMVGEFGEVQVMDWGLAKLLTEGESEVHGEPESNGRLHGQGFLSSTLSLSAPQHTTEPNRVMGSIQYMAPEQARGEDLDRRCDVFSLGAILCETLTGKPPYTGTSREQVESKAKTADLTEAWARLDGCGADPELVRLAKCCLAGERDARPRDAGAVAKEVATYLAGVEDRLRRAEVERAEAQVKAAEMRKRLRMQLALATALLFLVVGGGTGGWLWLRRGQEIDRAVEGAMTEARLLLQQAKAAPLGDASRFDQAAKAARQAHELARTSGASARVRRESAGLVETAEQETEAAKRDRTLLAACLEARGPRDGPRFRPDGKGAMLAVPEPSADEQFRSAFLTWGLNVDATPTAEAAARLRARPATVVEEVLAALDEWASERRQQKRPKEECERLEALAQTLDEAPGLRQELRAMLARSNLAQERVLGTLALALRPVPVPFDAGLGKDRSRLRELAASTDPAKEPVLGLLTLARALREAGDEREGERLLRAAVVSRPREVVLHNALAVALARQRRWQESAQSYGIVRALRPEFGLRLARALFKSARVAEGEALFAQLLAERKDPWLYAALGSELDDQGRYADAEAAYRRALRLARNFPAAHNGLGVVLFNRGDDQNAIKAFRHAIRLDQNVPESHYNLGNVLTRQGRQVDALRAYHRAIALRSDFGAAHNNLGVALANQGQHKEATRAFSESIRLMPDAIFPYNNIGHSLNELQRYPEAESFLRRALSLEPNYPEAHYNLGTSLLGQNRYPEAETAFRRAISLRKDFALAHNGLGITLARQRRHGKAQDSFRRAIHLVPGYPAAHFNLGQLLLDQHHYTDAEASFRKAIRHHPQHPEAHGKLAYTLLAQNRNEKAVKEYGKAIRLKCNYPEAHYNLGNALRRLGRLADAESAYQNAIRYKKNYPEAHCNLGHTLVEQGKFAAALEPFSEGHRIGSMSPGWKYPSAAWVRRCEQLVQLDEMLPKVLSGKAEPGTAAQALDLAYLCHHPSKRLYATAARLSADALVAAPQLATNLQTQPRYIAARSAALAATGKGEDAKLLPDRVVLALRRQALGWLRADLAVYTQLAKRDPRMKAAVNRRLTHWKQDRDLASVHDTQGLAQLPEDERAAWRRLWDDVEALRKLTQGK